MCNILVAVMYMVLCSVHYYSVRHKNVPRDCPATICVTQASRCFPQSREGDLTSLHLPYELRTLHAVSAPLSPAIVSPSTGYVRVLSAMNDIEKMPACGRLAMCVSLLYCWTVQPVYCETDADCGGDTCGVHPQRWADGSYKGGVEQGSCGTHIAWVSGCEYNVHSPQHGSFFWFAGCGLPSLVPAHKGLGHENTQVHVYF